MSVKATFGKAQLKTETSATNCCLQRIDPYEEHLVIVCVLGLTAVSVARQGAERRHAVSADR